MFKITIQGQHREITYDCEEEATLIYSHIIGLYPTLNVQLVEEIYYEAWTLLKENNPIPRKINPYRTTRVWLGIPRI